MLKKLDLSLQLVVLVLCIALTYGQDRLDRQNQIDDRPDRRVPLEVIPHNPNLDKDILHNFPKLCNVKDFDDFLFQANKTYPESERSFRESLFKGTKALIDSTNKQAAAGFNSYRLELNTLADMTRDEISVLFGSKITVAGEVIVNNHTNFVTAKSDQSNLPEKFDWREKGCVTGLGYQAKCGSCWSFATVASLEGHLCRRTGILVELSEQDLVDCAKDYGTSGCEGGFQEYAFEYIRDHGISISRNYPFTQNDKQCTRDQNQIGDVQIRDYGRIKPGDEEKMKEIIATQGPLACSMNAATKAFDQYQGGIFDDDECNQEDVNHSVSVVGYGSEDGRDYWIIKNSYSENWGERGFMKLLRNANSFCGIADECSYPIL